MLVLLVGPKGSGKSHAGRLLQARLGVHFFHVEPLWMGYHAECRSAGREPVISDGIARVHPQIAQALREHGDVCVETTGASTEILQSLLSLASPSQRLVVRLRAPLDVCMTRIASREPTHQISMDEETIRKAHALSEALQLSPDITIENTFLTDAQLLAHFETALGARRAGRRMTS